MTRPSHLPLSGAAARKPKGITAGQNRDCWLGHQQSCCKTTSRTLFFPQEIRNHIMRLDAPRFLASSFHQVPRAEQVELSVSPGRLRTHLAMYTTLVQSTTPFIKQLQVKSALCILSQSRKARILRQPTSVMKVSVRSLATHYVYHSDDPDCIHRTTARNCSCCYFPVYSACPSSSAAPSLGQSRKVTR